MFPHLGLKASTDLQQIDERLQYQPDVFEFYTTSKDVSDDGIIHLRQMIEYVKQHGVHSIVIHHPMKFGKIHNELFADATGETELYEFMMTGTERLIKVALAEDVQLLVHGSYNEPVSLITTYYPNVDAARDMVFHRLDYFAALGGQHIMFENSISPIFPFGDPKIDARIQAKHYRLCFDTSHGFIYTHGDNLALLTSLKRLRPQIVHYHLVDSMGQFHDSLSLGKGKIDWAKVYPELNSKATNIFEINLKDQNNSQEMRDSYQYLNKIAHEKSA